MSASSQTSRNDSAAPAVTETPRPHALGQILLASGLITSEQLQKALERQKRTRQHLGQILVDTGVTTPDAILAALSAQLAIPATRVNVYTIDPQAITVLPEKVARDHFVFPLLKVGKKLTLAVAGPKNLVALDDLRFASGCQIQPVVALEEEIAAALDRYYGGVGWLEEERSDEQGTVTIDVSSPFEARERDEEAERSAIQVVERLIARAVGDGASDIHLEPTAEAVRVRFRVDGNLRDVTRFASGTAPAVTSRIKVLAGMDIAEHRLPQDGRFSAAVAGRRLDLRTSTYPGMFGEKVVLRLLDQSALRLQLDNLGLDASAVSEFRDMIRRPEGILLITGPTGSGKTSTLYAALSEIVESGKNVMTIEDPVEYAIPGITQGQTNTRSGFTFARGLRAILRQDPDVVMVGEIRDAETLETAIEASLTGHLVLSTLHTSSAIGTITRLEEMGTEPYVLASSLLGIVAQRLVRRICATCKRDAPTPPGAQHLFAGQPPAVLYRGAGCQDCYGGGFRGRIGVYEMVRMNDELRSLIIERAPEAKLVEAARRNGARSLRAECLARVADGDTTLEEIVRITSERT